MYFRVRNLTGTSKQNEIIVKISKMAKIKELKEIISQKMQVEVEKQVLLYKGKQLVEEHKILDYDIQLNDVVQLMVKTSTKPIEGDDEVKDEDKENRPTENSLAESEESVKENGISNVNILKKELIKAESMYYKVGDLVDVKETEQGAWFEANIIEVLKDKDASDEKTDFIYKVQMERGEVIDTHAYKFNEIRPRSHYVYKKEELKEKMVVLASYNIEEPNSRGFWYDFQIEQIFGNKLKGTIMIGRDNEPIKDCIVKFIDETMRIEEAIMLSERENDKVPKIPLRKQPYKCNKCKDLPSRKCKSCGCAICAGKENPDKIIMCDECDNGYHLDCLNPPLTEVPADPEWYCPDCKVDENEIVKAGDKLKFSNKKAKLASNKSSTSRDWGSGMACVGRTKECTIVPKDHYGPVPGVEVGTCWKFRLQVSEAGIHRPHVAGIHGRETDGAYSLVLSGGYEDDVDNGEEFYYTGSGGRDLSGNKRVNEQSSDQKLTRMNKALALNCNAKFNDKTGAEAVDWKAGKPVRVVRNYKLSKHSKYAPKDGNRYDGVYKVVKYYPEKGKSGFIVWRYLLHRDDPAPAPWEKGGQELEMIYPPGYLEAQEAEQETKMKESKGKEKKEKEKRVSKEKTPKKETPKRKLTDFFNTPANKKAKLQTYQIPADVLKEVEADKSNEKLWKECQDVLVDGKPKFLSKVEELFMCICCQEVVYKPITTDCGHNICKSCLKRSFKSEIYTCPYCRFDLGADYEMEVNESLGKALQLLFPGYEASR